MAVKKRIIHLVDSIDYARNNCFQHQLTEALHSEHQVATFALEDVLNKRLEGNVDVILSCLKQRTLYRNTHIIKQYIGTRPIVIYDQDPWESFKDGGPFKGAYNEIASQLNVRAFALTTQWWVDYINSRGDLPAATFVPMWLLPRYCKESRWDTRPINLGFVGGVHSYRYTLFEKLRQLKHPVHVEPGSSRGYTSFLSRLSDMKMFVHSEDAPLTIDGTPTNMGTGLWIKDVEAAARGCFSIRNRLDGHETYLSGLKTVRLYDDPDEVPDIIRSIQRMDPIERQSLTDQAVQRVRGSHRWQETVKTLTSL